MQIHGAIITVYFVTSLHFFGQIVELGLKGGNKVKMSYYKQICLFHLINFTFKVKISS